MSYLVTPYFPINPAVISVRRMQKHQILSKTRLSGLRSKEVKARVANMVLIWLTTTLVLATRALALLSLYQTLSPKLTPNLMLANVGIADGSDIISCCFLDFQSNTTVT